MFTGSPSNVGVAWGVMWRCFQSEVGYAPTRPHPTLEKRWRKVRVWSLRQQQDWILKGLQGGRALLLSTEAAGTDAW